MLTNQCLPDGRLPLPRLIVWASVITTLLVSTLSIVGCDLYTQYHPYGALSKSANAQAELNSERAALVRQYRECLAKKEANPQVSCSEYRIAIEVIESAPRTVAQ